MCLVRYLQLIIQLANRKDRQASRGSLQSLMRFSDASSSSSTRRSSRTASLSSNTRSSWSTVESHPLNQKHVRENARSSLPGQQQSLLNPQRDGEARLRQVHPSAATGVPLAKNHGFSQPMVAGQSMRKRPMRKPCTFACQMVP